MTPQEIMNLPYAGMAEKQLREQKGWRLDPSEKLRLIMDKISNDVDELIEYSSAASCHLEDLYTALEGNE